jgi:ADP-heptose:LPS heptosyltransferase
MKVLIIQLRAIGDVICSTPLIDDIKKNIPDVQIDFLVEPVSAPVVETHPGLHRVLIYDKKNALAEIRRVREQKYDAVLDFMNNPRTSYLTFFSGARWKVAFELGLRSLFYNVRVPVPKQLEYVPQRRLRMVRAWMAAMGMKNLPAPDINPKVYLTKEDVAFAEEWIRSEHLEGKPFVIIVPIHKHPICRWRKAGFQYVARELKKRGFPVYLAWGPGEEELIEQVRNGNEDLFGLRPPDNLRKIAAVFQRAKFVLANNSGAMHLAVAVGAPTVTIYGPTRAVDWNNPAPSHIPLMAENVACLGCRLKACPVGHLCMTELKEETVLKACLSLTA